MTLVESFGIIPLKNESGKWRVFLVRHKGGNHWGFPKGRGHTGETPLESASRELKEETNLTMKTLLRPTALVEQYQFRIHREEVFKRVSYFVCLVEGEVHLQQEEIAQGKWVDLDQAEQALTFEEARSLCRQVLHEMV